jgi:4-hydroxy-tetrahydrodipicolinate reductase
MLNIQLSGRNGRMALALTEALSESESCTLVADPQSTEFDTFIDFSTIAGTRAALSVCLEKGKALVIGTTGFDETFISEIRQASHSIPIVFAPNMSVGVNVLFKLVELASGVLGESSDIEISEAHHQNKVDAPSGTALKLGQIVATALGSDLASRAVYSREGNTGERATGSIGFQSLRAGDIVGEHSVMLASAGERLELVHKASSRRNYAEGALRAALWLENKNSGLYDMQDVLGLNHTV